MASLQKSARSAQWAIATPEELEGMYIESAAYLSSHSKDWNLLEQHFYLTLLTNRDVEAKAVLDRLTDRFGLKSHRVGVLRARYIEAVEGAEVAQDFFKSRANNDFPAYKAKNVVLKSTGQLNIYVDKLLKLLSVTPNDAETWAELAEVYYTLGLYHQAIHSLQEVIIQFPLAYNIHARIGEIYHVVAVSEGARIESCLRSSLQHYLRAVELCPKYARGWVGVKVVSFKLASIPRISDAAKYREIDTLAKRELSAIISSNSSPPIDVQVAKKILT